MPTELGGTQNAKNKMLFISMTMTAVRSINSRAISFQLTDSPNSVDIDAIGNSVSFERGIWCCTYVPTSIDNEIREKVIDN